MNFGEYDKQWTIEDHKNASNEGWFMDIFLGLIANSTSRKSINFHEEIQHKAEAGSKFHQRALTLHTLIQVTR